MNTHIIKDASKILKAWYMRQAKYTFPIRVDYYAQKYNFKFKQVKISNASRRWGSCSSKGSINLNWRLIRAIPEAIDYVIVHELVHTIHMDHSKRFWEKVAEIMPDYKKYRAWLKNHGYLLDFMYED
jgi:predicted metal-dependent hydrolase